MFEDNHTQRQAEPYKARGNGLPLTGPRCSYRPKEYRVLRSQPAQVKSRAAEANLTVGSLFVDTLAMYGLGPTTQEATRDHLWPNLGYQ